MLNKLVRSPARVLIHSLRNLKQKLEESGVDRVNSLYPVTEPVEDASRFYSQWGEDRLLRRIFRSKTSGIAIEVGGFDGVTFSNTYHFEQLGWKTIVVEPMPEFARKIRANRKTDLYECAAGAKEGEAVLNIAKGAEDLSTFNPSGYQLENIKFHGGTLEQVKVQVRTLDSILTSAGVGSLDFVTIDVEGHEEEALAGFTLSRWKPEIVIIEDISMGAGTAIKNIMQAKGYRCFMTTGCNDWFAPVTSGHYFSFRSKCRDKLRTLVCKALAIRDALVKSQPAPE